MPGRGGRGPWSRPRPRPPASEADADEPPQHRVIYNADLWEKVLDYLQLPDAARWRRSLCQDHWALRAAASRTATGLDLCFRTEPKGEGGLAHLRRMGMEYESGGGQLRLRRR